MTQVTQPPDRRRPWWHTLLLMSVPAAGYLLTMLVVHSVSGSPVLASTGGALSAIALYGPGLRLAGLNRSPARTWRHEVPWTSWLLVFVVVWLAGQLLTIYLYDSWPTAARAYDLRVDSITATIPGAWLVLSLLLAPVAEEMLLRGLLYRGLRQIMRLPVVMSVLISAALFSALHTSLVLAPATFMLGVLLALVYERTRSLWAPVGLHLLFNLLAQVIPAAAVSGLASAVPVAVLVVVAMLMLGGLVHAVHQSEERDTQLVE